MMSKMVSKPVVNRLIVLLSSCAAFLVFPVPGAVPQERDGSGTTSVSDDAVGTEHQGLTDPDRRARLLIAPPRNAGTSPQNEVVAASMAQSMAVTLRLLGEYEVVVPGDREGAVLRDGMSSEAGGTAGGGGTSPVGGGSGLSGEDVPALQRLAEDGDLDYVVAGEITDTTTGGLRFEIVVYDHTAGALTIREVRDAESVFDTFDVADEITLEIASALSGRRIIVGSISIRRTDPQIGAYAVFLDDEFFGIDASRITGIPAGERTVRIVTGAGTGAAATIFNATVRVDGDTDTPIELTAPDSTDSLLAPRLVSYGEPPPPDEAAVAGPVTTTGSLFDPRIRRILRLAEGAEAEAGSIDGVNPNASLYHEATAHIPPPDRADRFRRFSLPTRYPDIPWRIDGDPAEWPDYIPAYTVQEGIVHGYVSARYYRVAYTPERIVLEINLTGDFDRLFSLPDPRIKIDLSVSEPGERVRLQILRRERGRRSSGYFMDGYTYSGGREFREVPGFRVAWRDDTVELAVPISFLGASPGARVELTNFRVYERVDLAYDDDISVQTTSSDPMEALP